MEMSERRRRIVERAQEYATLNQSRKQALTDLLEEIRLADQERKALIAQGLPAPTRAEFIDDSKLARQTVYDIFTGDDPEKVTPVSIL